MPYIFFFKIKNCLNDDLLNDSLTGLEKCCITSAYLQCLCHSGERPVALLFLSSPVNSGLIETKLYVELPVGWGNESLFMVFGSNDQNIRHAHIWFKPFENVQDLKGRRP